MAWYPLFAHVRTILEIFHELVQLWTSYTWLLCGEITKPDIRLTVWQLCLLGNSFHYQRHNRWHDKDYATTTASSTVTVLVVETNGSLVAHGRPKSRAFNVKSTFPIQQRTNLSALSKSSLFTCRARDKLETDVLRTYMVKINGS